MTHWFDRANLNQGNFAWGGIPYAMPDGDAKGGSTLGNASKNSHKELTPFDPKHMKVVPLTMVAAAPIEEAPAAFAALGRLMSRIFRASEEGGVKTVGQGTTVFRVWGDGAKPWGGSWTPVDPRTLPNYRNAAGLPNQNSGRFLSEGILRSTTGVTAREALPLHGGAGGLREMEIPHAQQQIQLQNVQGLNPQF
jgi:hypothetical protein